MDRPVQRGQLAQLGHKVQPVRLARVANKAFKGCKAYRGLLV